MKHRAQAASMMRQADSALRLLLRMQEARRKLEADNAACDRAAWTEHCALGLMAEAIAAPPPTAQAPPAPAPCPDPGMAEPPAPAREPSKTAPSEAPAGLEPELIAA